MDTIIIFLCFIATVAVSLCLDLSDLGMIVAYFFIFTIGVLLIMIKDGYGHEDIIAGLKEWIGDWLYHIKLVIILGLIFLVIGFALSSPRMPY